jgi:acetylornithine deacetylase/succinyl-diaminopimelate desuccinylase-like protein
VLIIDRIVDAEMGNLISNLQRLIREPSVSAKSQRLDLCANLVNDIMQKAGINSSVYYLDSHNKVPQPVIYGEIRSRSNPFGKTILFYNHYDVQPIEPLNAWSIPPFGGLIYRNKIFGRGASDDKGELITRIKAVECILKEKGDVPCNIKFFVEGEEEIGSPNIGRYIQMLRQKIDADAVIWEFGYVDTKNRPIINLGMKGMLYVELAVHGPSTPLHSSLAVLVKNPSWDLVKALGTIWDEKRSIIPIREWYKDVVGFTKEELIFIANQALFDETDFKTKYKISRFLNDLKGNDVKKALAGTPTCNISGLHAGNGQQDTRTVIPSVARAKIDFRLVPKMEPKKQFDRLKDHLKRHGFGNVDVRYVHGVSASRTSHTNRFVKIVRDSAERTFGARAIINLSSAGSGPMHNFSQMLRCPCVAVGCTSIFANIHSYNEYASIDLLNKGTKCIISIIENMSQVSYQS